MRRVLILPSVCSVFLRVLFWSAPPASAQTGADEQRLAGIQRSIQAGDLRRASNELDDLRKRLAGEPRIYNLLGAIAARENDVAAAEANFRKAIQLAPRFTAAYMNLGRLYQENAALPGALEKALEVYRKVLEFAPSDVEANYQEARLFNQLGKFGLSLRYLARLPPGAQRQAAALALRCVNQAGLGRLVQAEADQKLLSAAEDLTESDVLPMLAILDAHEAGDLGTRLLEALDQRGLVSAAGLRAMGGLLEKQGRLVESRRALEKVLKFEPPSAALLSQLARLAYQAKDLEGALGYLAHARDLEPANASIHFFFGLVCVDLKLPPEAREALREAVRLDPGNPDSHYALGAVLLQEKITEEAIAHFRKYRDIRPADPRGAFALGVAYFDAYQLDESRKALQAAAASPETRMGASLYLGRLALREDNNLAEADRWLNQAVQDGPLTPEPYAELALLQIRRNEYALARRSLDRALAIAPDHYRSNLNLLMLYQRTKDNRVKEQARVVEKLRSAGEERERMLLRSLEIRPY